jgi:NAD(P)H dehydrogenase (quinone)
MKVLIVLCHPVLSSFNAKIAQAVRDAVEAAGHIPVFHDLYRESFDPTLTEDEFKRGYSLDEQVQLYMDEVTEADILVFIHPDWWGQMPALLKGWIDRVFRSGIAFDYAGKDFLPKQIEKLMTGKAGIAYVTTDSEEGRTPPPLIDLWKEKIFGYCGVTGECRVFHSTRGSTSAKRKAWLDIIRANMITLLGHNDQGIEE